MNLQYKHYSVDHFGPFQNPRRDVNFMDNKYFAAKKLGLTGCEVSVSCLPARTGVPFVHAHRKNEELYIVVRGSGTFYADGDEFPVREGSMIRVAPEGARTLVAGDEDLYYICIQAEVGTLSQATKNDGYLVNAKASWMKD